jgi:hypothetical protein
MKNIINKIKKLFNNDNRTKLIGILTIVILFWIILYFIPNTFISLFNTLLGNFILLVATILVLSYNIKYGFNPTIGTKTNKGNKIVIRQKMYLGPFIGDEFKEVTVRSIHNSLSENVEEAGSNLQATLAIKLTNSKETLDRKQIRKGMVLIDNVDK